MPLRGFLVVDRHASPISGILLPGIDGPDMTECYCLKSDCFFAIEKLSSKSAASGVMIGHPVSVEGLFAGIESPVFPVAIGKGFSLK